MRRALATLPWVETRTIQPDKHTLHVRFGINDRAAFDEAEIRSVLGSHYGRTMVVKDVHEVEPTTTEPTVIDDAKKTE